MVLLKNATGTAAARPGEDTGASRSSARCRHALQRLVRRQPAVPGDPARRHPRAARRRRHGHRRRGPRPDRAARHRDRPVPDRDRHRRRRQTSWRPTPRPGAAAQFDVFDWRATSRRCATPPTASTSTGNCGPFITASERAQRAGSCSSSSGSRSSRDGTFLIQYVGYETHESWWWIPEHYVTVGADGTRRHRLARRTRARFAREVVSGRRRRGGRRGRRGRRRGRGRQQPVHQRPGEPRPHRHGARRQPAGADQGGPRGQPEHGRGAGDQLPDDTGQPAERRCCGPPTPGRRPGTRVADVLFGDHNPAGRLTQTWYRRRRRPAADLLNYDIIKSGQTYLYYRGKPLYPFGHGLSYTTFRYANLRDPRTSGRQRYGRVSVDVTNTGGAPATRSCSSTPTSGTSRDTVPLKQLRGFQRVTLAPGQTKTVRFPLPRRRPGALGRDPRPVGGRTSDYDLLVGASSARHPAASGRCA